MHKLLLLLSLISISLATPCVTHTWGTVGSAQFAPVASHDGEVFVSMGGFIGGLLTSYETTIQFRQIQTANFNIYSLMSYYEPNALDHFARKAVSDARRICPATPTNAADRKLHRSVTLAYGIVFLVRNHFPSASAGLEAYFGTWGILPNICDTQNCNVLSTPWGLAKTLTDEVRNYSRYDGWNHDGSLSAAYNKIPFRDWRSDPYVPRNSPWDLARKKRWQPLLEHNGLGYLSHQEHVTPFIGQTGRSVFLSDDEICDLKAPDPHYNLDTEMAESFRKSTLLNDDWKMHIETFDSKLTSLVPLMTQWFARATGSTNFDSWDFLKIDSIIISVLYETALVCWKEKERWDLVRPPSYAHAEWAGETVLAWAGPYQGTKLIKADDWKPYVRTMPHSEYPSGSSCVCSAFEAAMIDWSGYDNVTAHLGGPLVHAPFGQTSFPAGSSKVEPGTVPAQPWVGFYGSWSEVASVCGNSRLYGGMHFTKAVTAGRNLCYDIGTKLSQTFKGLNNGVVPSYVTSINPTSVPRERRCEQGND